MVPVMHGPVGQSGAVKAVGSTIDWWMYSRALSPGTRVAAVVPMWVRSGPIWPTALGMPVDIPADGDFGAAFGAARLGLIAAEDADPFAICSTPATSATVEPDDALLAAYAEAYSRYRSLYPAIRATMS